MFNWLKKKKETSEEKELKEYVNNFDSYLAVLNEYLTDENGKENVKGWYAFLNHLCRNISDNSLKSLEIALKNEKKQRSGIS